MLLVGLFAAASLGVLPQLQSTSTLSAGLQATNQIVGAVGINDALHATPRGIGYDGVAGLLITKSNGTFLCTGSMLWTGVDVLTAAHCLTDDAGHLDVSHVDAVFFPRSGGTAFLTGKSYRVETGYDGSVISDDDVALIRLTSEAGTGIDRYNLFRDVLSSSDVYDVVGFGGAGVGATGATIPAGTRRHGFNTFDVLLGRSVLLSDFDDGTVAHDANCAVFGVCDTGLGVLESSTAPGDSGGPAFIDGKIVAVTSFGARVGSPPDIDDKLNSSFGELNGFTDLQPHLTFIRESVAPEPAAFILLGTGLTMTGGLLGIRRRKS